MGWLRHHTPSKPTMWIFVCTPFAFGTVQCEPWKWYEETLSVVHACRAWLRGIKYLEFEVILPNIHNWTAGCLHKLKLWHVPKKNHNRMIVFSYLFHHICKEKDETHFMIHQHAYLCVKIYVRHLKYCRATLWQK